MKKQGNGLAYLTNVFPSLTTTFVYREVAEVRRLGIDIHLFSIHRPSAKELSPESRPFLRETHYILPPSVVGFVFSNLLYILRRPITYLRLLLTAVSSGSGSKDAWRSLMHLGMAGYVARMMERQHIGHVHVHFASSAASVAMFASELTNISFSFTVHAFDVFAEQLLLREKLGSAKFVVAISDYNRRALIEHVPEAADRIRVVHCGIDPSGYHPPDRDGQIYNHYILSIGQLVEKKGFIYLMEALKIIGSENVAFQCTILGDGYERGNLEHMVMASGLQSRVRLAGAVYQEVARSYLGVADIFVLPCVVAKSGDRDGIPVALMEAMAMELPVVSTTVSGIPELIEHMETGMLVPPRDSSALADALRELLGNAELRKKLGVRGREKVIEDFHLGKSALQMKTLFDSCLGASERPQLRYESLSRPATGVKDV